jgi:hypothetical protein
MSQISSLPEKTKQLIKDYFKLDLGGQIVPTPYYRNVKRVRAELRSKVGKGLPDEIEQECMIFAKLRGFEFHGKSIGDIREFMRSVGLGVDCSGFVAHVLDTYLKEIGKGNLYSNIKFPANRSLYKRIVNWLRPIEHIGADLMTNGQNTTEVLLNDVRPGDLLRLKGIRRGDHIAIITTVTKDDDDNLISIKYSHSTQHYGIEDGVRIGEIMVVDPKGSLLDQDWLEKDKDGVCWTKKQLEVAGDDGGLRRLK